MREIDGFDHGPQRLTHCLAHEARQAPALSPEPHTQHEQLIPLITGDSSSCSGEVVLCLQVLLVINANLLLSPPLAMQSTHTLLVDRPHSATTTTHLHSPLLLLSSLLAHRTVLRRCSRPFFTVPCTLAPHVREELLRLSLLAIPSCWTGRTAAAQGSLLLCGAAGAAHHSVRVSV